MVLAACAAAQRAESEYERTRTPEAAAAAGLAAIRAGMVLLEWKYKADLEARQGSAPRTPAF